MHDWYGRLIALRHSEIALTSGDLRSVQVCFDEARKWLRMTLGPIEVAFNVGPSEVDLEISSGYEMLLASGPEVACNGSYLGLPPDSVAVIRTKAAVEEP
jgi:hypothetical protein